MLQHSFCFMFVFWGECGILAPQPWIESTLPALLDSFILYVTFKLLNIKAANIRSSVSTLEVIKITD